MVGIGKSKLFLVGFSGSDDDEEEDFVDDEEFEGGDNERRAGVMTCVVFNRPCETIDCVGGALEKEIQQLVARSSLSYVFDCAWFVA